MGNVGSVWEMLPYFIYICMGTEKTVKIIFLLHILCIAVTT